MLIGLKMHIGFVKTVFLKIWLTIVRGIYRGKFFMHVLDRSIFQKPKRLMTFRQFVIRPLIPKLFISSRFS